MPANPESSNGRTSGSEPLNLRSSRSTGTTHIYNYTPNLYHKHMKQKTCSRCKQPKDIEQFHKDRIRKDGHAYRCKDCCKEINRAWYEADPERAKREWREAAKRHDTPGRLRNKRYKMPLGQYEKMLSEQSGRCLICNKEKVLVVDHDHKSGRVRGLLCGLCNTGIGALQDNADILQIAINYLMREEGEVSL